MFHGSHLLTLLQQEGGHWAFFHSFETVAMAQPRGDYSRVQISVDICASAAPTNDPWTVEHLLQHFHMDAYQCEVNDLIFPMMSGSIGYSGKKLSTSFLADAILAQWESVIQPLDAQDVNVDDAEMGESSQDGQ